MKIIKLRRTFCSDEVTLGFLSTGKNIYATLELPDRANTVNISCIPEGAYVCKRGAIRGKMCYFLKDVPGRTSIAIHRGNTVDDTRGCILIGSIFGKFYGEFTVIESKKSMEKLLEELGEDPFIIDIRKWV